MGKPVCVIVGVGPGNGAAFARRFDDEGYRLALLARTTDFSSELASQLDDARAYARDVTDAAAIERCFAAIRQDLGEVDVLLYNAGSGVWGTFEDVSAEDFDRAWQINARGAFLASREVTPGMKARGSGSIVFTGATASLRGGAQFTAFASAKAAQRNLAQSMARHLGQFGIHVALIIIDGMINLERTRQAFPDKDEAEFLQPADIADAVFYLTQQPASAWTFELDVRPAAEKW